jgi:hypothetical protein
MRTLKHFFVGAQSKEETASAYLATLLDSDPVFRSRFLDLAHVEPGLDGSLDWAVRVEDSRVNTGAVDVTLEWPRGDPTTFIMVENKVAASAKDDGQFRKYYRGAVAAWPGRRVVGLYLAPSRGLAASEIGQVKATEEYIARGGGRPDADEVFAIDWENDVTPIVRGLPSASDWFVASGIDEVLNAIKHPPLPPDQQRDTIRRIVDDAVADLGGAVPGNPFQPWHSKRQEAVYKPGGMLTIWVTVVFPVDEGFRLLHDVVVDDVVRVTLVTHFGLRVEAVKPPEVVQAWRAILRERRVLIGDMEFEPTPSRRLFFTDEQHVSRAGLQALLVERALQMVAFLRSHPELRAFD